METGQRLERTKLREQSFFPFKVKLEHACMLKGGGHARMQGRFRAFRLGSQGTGPVVAVVGSKSCKAAEGSREALWPNDLDQYPGEGSGAL